MFFDIGTTPGSSAVVYRAIQATANIIELYRVPFATPGLSTKLNGVLPPNADIHSFKIAPDNASVIYVDLQNVPPTPPSFQDVISDLYRVPFAMPGQSTKLNASLVGTPIAFLQLIGQYDITPDSSSVVYTAESQTSDFRALYRVPFATPGQSTRLTAMFISSFAIRPDSSGVVYGSPKVVTNLDQNELYLVPFATPGGSTKLNGPLVAGGSVQSEFGISFRIAPDNSSVVYVADETTNDIIEIYRVPFSTPGVSTKLNGPLVAGGGVSPFDGNISITPDSSSVLYLADHTTNDVHELYRVPFAAPGVSTKLNGPLTSGGDVTEVLVK
ncbi:MAG: hypothetical protein ABIS18_11990 [Actinomycetota bacterium]